jgi:diguanylate cyclase (GGDEF)-like protein
VSYFDLDNFKRVNDAHGHAAGDDVLVRFAAALKAQTRATDLPARTGGDEFALLLWRADADEARSAAGRIVAAAAEIGRQWPDTGFGASAGVAWFERCPADADAILRAADEAMYEAKAAGKGQVRLRAMAAQPSAVS